MCMSQKPVETIKRSGPDATAPLPIPPATPDVRLTGDGMVRGAARKVSGRQRQIDAIVDQASR